MTCATSSPSEGGRLPARRPPQALKASISHGNADVSQQQSVTASDGPDLGFQRATARQSRPFPTQEIASARTILWHAAAREVTVHAATTLQHGHIVVKPGPCGSACRADPDHADPAYRFFPSIRRSAAASRIAASHSSAVYARRGAAVMRRIASSGSGGVQARAHATARCLACSPAAHAAASSCSAMSGDNNVDRGNGGTSPVGLGGVPRPVVSHSCETRRASARRGSVLTLTPEREPPTFREKRPAGSLYCRSSARHVGGRPYASRGKQCHANHTRSAKVSTDGVLPRRRA
jgi:hypothetical protein